MSMTGKMLPDCYPELELIKVYKLDRTEGLDYVKVLSDAFLNQMLNTTDVNISSMFKYSKLISITLKLLYFIDITLLEEIEDYTFDNIIYSNEDEEFYYFEVVYENN